MAQRKPSARSTKSPRSRRTAAQRVTPPGGQTKVSRAPRRSAKGSFRPPSTEELPRYAGVASLLRLPVIGDFDALPEVDAVLCGVPFDGAVNYRPGARLGPRGVREASFSARAYSAALGVDVFAALRVADGGDVVVSPGDIEGALQCVAARAEVLARSGIVAGFVGGDQTTTLGALRGIRRAKLKPVGLVHIDARPDARHAALGRRIHHESVVRNLVEEGLIRADRSIQIGIRGPFGAPDAKAFSLAQNFEIATTDHVKWDLYSVVTQLRKTLLQGPVYVTVDISVLDPAFAPGTGSPVPGGLNPWELQQLLRALVGADVVGFDVVEIAPGLDPCGITALAGVTVLQEILSAMADTRGDSGAAPSCRANRGRRVSA